MKLKAVLVFSAIVVIFAERSYAIADCERPIAKVWSGNDTNKIYVIHGDGYAPSGMRLNSLGNTDKDIDRSLSLILAGYMSGKSVTFRYTGNSTCTPESYQEFIGAWVGK